MRNQGAESNFWLGTEAGYLGAYGFPGAIVATDGAVRNGSVNGRRLQKPELAAHTVGKPREEVAEVTESDEAGASPIMPQLSSLGDVAGTLPVVGGQAPT